MGVNKLRTPLSCFFKLGSAFLSVATYIVSNTAYAGGASLSDYDVYKGDINKDGISDFVFSIKTRLIMIVGDITFPIFAPVNSGNGYVIYGRRDSTGYDKPQVNTLNPAILNNMLATSQIKPAALNADFYTLQKGSTAVAAILLRGQSSSDPSLLLKYDPSIPNAALSNQRVFSLDSTTNYNLSDRNWVITLAPLSDGENFSIDLRSPAGAVPSLSYSYSASFNNPYVPPPPPPTTPLDSEAEIRLVWANTVDAMLRNDLSALEKTFSLSGFVRYKPVFLALRAELPSIARQMIGIDPMYMSDNSAVFILEVVGEDGGRYLQNVSFIKDEKGIWKVDAL